MTAEPLWHTRSAETPAAQRSAPATSFEALYREHHARLYRFCLGMTRTHAVAEDIAQEALLRAFLHRDDLDPHRSPWPWLKKVATRLVYDHSRSQRTVADCTTTDGVVPDGAGVYADRELVRQMLGTLPERQRAAVTLRYLDDWKSAEIAAVLGLPRPAVEQLLLRARRSLKTEYRRLSGDRLRLALWPLLAWSLRMRQRVARGVELAADARLPSLATSAETMSALLVAGALSVGAGFGGADHRTTTNDAGYADMRRADAIATTGQWASRAQGGVPLTARTGAAGSGREAPSPARPAVATSRSGADRRVDVAPSGASVTDQHVRPAASASVVRDGNRDELRISSDLVVESGDHAPTIGRPTVVVPCKGGMLAKATCGAYDAAEKAAPDAP